MADRQLTLPGGLVVTASDEYSDDDVYKFYGLEPPQRPRRAWAAGVEGLKSTTTQGAPLAWGKATGTLSPLDEARYMAGLRDSARRQDELLPGGPASFADVRSGDAGVGDWLGENFAYSAPQMIPSVVGAVGGGLVGNVPGALAGGALGQSLVAPSYVGSNVNRATEGGQRQLSQEYADRALVAGAGQAAVDLGAEALLGPVVGRAFPGGEITGSLLRRSVVGAGKGFAIEGASEIGQQAMERWSVGEGVLGPGAGQEYLEAGLLGGVLGGALGAVGGTFNARPQAEEPFPIPAVEPIGERTTPTSLLALPGPDTISARPSGPTLFADAEGVASENPAAIAVSRAAEPGADLYRRMSALQAQPEGAQADWVSGDYSLPADEPPAAPQPGSQVVETGQPELPLPASSTVANDFDAARVTRILRGPGKVDGFVARTAPQLATALKANDLAAAQALVDNATETLQGDVKLSPATVEARRGVLERAQLVLDTYKSRMADAFTQEAATRREVAPTPATVVVDPAPVEPAVQGYAQPDMLARNETMAATDEARRAQVLQRALNTPRVRNVEGLFQRMLEREKLDTTISDEELGQLVDALDQRQAMDDEAAARDEAAAQTSTADIEAQIPERAARPAPPVVPEAAEVAEPATVVEATETPAQEVAQIAAPDEAAAARQQAMADMAAERAPRAQPAAVDTTATEKLIETAFDRKEIVPTQFTQLKHMLEAKAPPATVEAALDAAKAQTAQTLARYSKKRWAPKPDDLIVDVNGKSINMTAMDDLFQRLRAELTYKGFGDAGLKLVLGDDVRTGDVPGLPAVPEGQPLPYGNMTLAKGNSKNGFTEAGRRIIQVVADPSLAGGEMRTLNHEIIHLARDMNVWTPQEWSTLEAWAAKQTDRVNTVDKLYAADNLTDEQTLEEVIAEAYSDWEHSRTPTPPQVRTLFQKLKDFLATVARTLKLLPPEQKAALRTYLSFGPEVDTIFSNLSSGAIGDRPRSRFNLSPLAARAVADRDSRKAQPSMLRRAATDEVKQATKTISDELRGMVGDKPARYTSALMLGPSLTDFARRVGLRSALAYDRLVRAAGRKTGVINERATELAAAYAALPTKLLGTGEGTLNSLAEASTRTGKWAFEPDWLDEEDLRGRKPEVDPDLAARLQAMGPKAEAVMREMFRLPHETFKQKKLVLDKTIQHTADDEIKAAEAAGDILEVARLKAQLNRARDHYRTLNDVDMSKPYASLQRSGDKVVVARSAELAEAEAAAQEGDKEAAVRVEEMKGDPAHYFFDAFDGNGEQARVARALEARPEFAGNVDMFTKSDEEYLRAGGVEMMMAFRRLSNMLEDAGVDVDIRPMQRLLTDMYLRTLSSSSSRKAELRRLGVDSMPLDIMQNVINQARSDAHAIGAMSTIGEKTDVLAELKREARDKSRGQTTADKMAAYTEIMKREAASMEPPARNALVDNVLAATSSYMLTTSPSYFIQNALQNQTTVIPQLAAEHGYAKAQSALAKGYKQVKQAWSKTPLAKPLDFDALDPRMAELGHYLQDEGQLDVGLNQDLGNIQALSANPVSQAATTVFSKLRAMVRLIEATGRYAAGVAAFNLAMEKGSTAETLTDPAAYDAYVANRSEMREGGHVLSPAEFAAAQHARKIISLAHGIYSPHAKPRFMNSPIGKVATQFRVFQILQLTLWADAIQKVFSGTTSPDEKRVAKRALGFMLAHTAALAGGLGLPGMALFKALAEGVMDMFGGDDDEPADLERSLRETVKDPGLANLLLYGAPSLAGLDLSGSLGSSTILSIAPYADPVTDRQSLANYFTAVFGGPSVAGVGMNYADGLNLMARGSYYKGLEKFLPKGVSNVMKAGREATEGRTNRSGDVTRAPSDVDAVQTIYTALGLRTAERANEQWALSTEIERKQFQKDKAARIKRDYTQAARAGRSEEMARLRKEWQALQANKPTRERQPLAELLKAPTEQRKRERQTVGGLQYSTRTRQRAEELAALAGLAETPDAE